jgi:hypothetical protein
MHRPRNQVLAIFVTTLGGHRHVHLRGVLTIQVPAGHAVRGQPQVAPDLDHQRGAQRRVQPLHAGVQRHGGRRRGTRVRALPVPRRPGQRRLRAVRAELPGAAEPGVRGRVRGVAAAGRVLRALRQRRLPGAARHGHGVPQVQHQQRRRVPPEPGRPASRPADGRGQRVQGEQRRRRAGRRAVPRRRRLRDVPRPGGRPAQGHLRHRAGCRRVPRAVLRQVLGQRIPLPPHARCAPLSCQTTQTTGFWIQFFAKIASRRPQLRVNFAILYDEIQTNPWHGISSTNRADWHRRGNVFAFLHIRLS